MTVNRLMFRTNTITLTGLVRQNSIKIVDNKYNQQYIVVKRMYKDPRR